MVSDNGSLCVYDVRFNRPMMKTTSAHAGEATSVDWHPADKYVLATSGGRDRLVKGRSILYFFFFVSLSLSLFMHMELMDNIIFLHTKCGTPRAV